MLWIEMSTEDVADIFAASMKMMTVPCSEMNHFVAWLGIVRAIDSGLAALPMGEDDYETGEYRFNVRPLIKGDVDLLVDWKPVRLDRRFTEVVLHNGGAHVEFKFGAGTTDCDLSYATSLSGLIPYRRGMPDAV